MYFIKPEAIIYWNKRLNLRATGREQDWEVELADSSRVDEFISIYESNMLSDDKKFALMALITASLDDLASIKAIGDDVMKRVVKILCDDYDLNKPLIDYWSSGANQPSPDCFCVAELMQMCRFVIEKKHLT